MALPKVKFTKLNESKREREESRNEMMYGKFETTKDMNIDI